MEEEKELSEHELEEIKNRVTYFESDDNSEEDNSFIFIQYEPPSSEHFDKVSLGCAFILGVLLFCIPSFFISNHYSEL